MLTIKRNSFSLSDLLWDKDGKPCFVEPPGHHIPGPLRVTAEEWREMCLCHYADANIFLHGHFTMTSEMVPTNHGVFYDRQITLACPRAKPKWAVFGPYERGVNRAAEKAKEYLVKAGVLKIVEDSEQKEAHYE